MTSDVLTENTIVLHGRAANRDQRAAPETDTGLTL